MRAVVTAGFFAALLSATPSAGQMPYESWPVLTDPFPSTGGGGIMIYDYDPVVADGTCSTHFRAIEPNGTVYRNAIVFDAIATQGGILCTNGRWRSLDGDAAGTTPFRVFIKDGVKRGSGD
ncbi:hypothetical protein [Bosea sp. (in: a-proteobacteria)]|uniref:hypothetical protein n=1 Tax=Bosea sp. (in: a-proteobacteria) TaxID=1871050 RepID=UPI0027373257|nr:hypothetical protein [Bosea sp. (in: a-proteobacteria)]MDP3410408.1 hypothetical protein [Bosea sp. (in: a-proteobacteria)]